ncbi:helix-turn-helix domain-containing protein [Lactobacillus terrae]|uniref:helix-turn-helix domain-containing protein n=1 Tax=Lactobacillus terrae TaxID=2269374 RepID=UPI000C1B7875|nr:helix-turn-helix transcriptional regulator [Lactobacillus terrae]
MTIFDNIKNISKNRGMSLQEVAEKSGLSKNMIYQYNKGKQPSLDTVKKIAKTLNVEDKEILGLNNTNDRPKEIDLKEAFEDDYTLLSWQGMEIPDEEKEMIRRILNGGK